MRRTTDCGPILRFSLPFYWRHHWLSLLTPLGHAVNTLKSNKLNVNRAAPYITWHIFSLAKKTFTAFCSLLSLSMWTDYSIALLVRPQSYSSRFKLPSLEMHLDKQMWHPPTHIRMNRKIASMPTCRLRAFLEPLKKESLICRTHTHT